MPRKKKKKTIPNTIPPLARFWQQERERNGLTLAEIAERTDIPDATLSRWFAGEVTDLKASQIAKVSIAMGIPVWKSFARLGIGDDTPADPDAEAQQLALILSDEPELRTMLDDVLVLGPRDRRAVRKLAEMLKQGESLEGQSDPPGAPESSE